MFENLETKTNRFLMENDDWTIGFRGRKIRIEKANWYDFKVIIHCVQRKNFEDFDKQRKPLFLVSSLDQ